MASKNANHTTTTRTAEARPIYPILLPCPCCGEQRASIQLQLACLGGQDNEFRCIECENEFTTAHLEDLIRRWTAVLAWIQTAPAIDD